MSLMFYELLSLLRSQFSGANSSTDDSINLPLSKFIGPVANAGSANAYGPT
nr:MAG TPA: hypothetical protein [Caudoviricetes sp.]